MKTRQTGFTLVEIAIVLVIIGLLLGGVLKGQELINSAKVKNFANDFRTIPLFIYGYQDKYKALPGDDKLATDHLGATATLATTPDKKQGNGVIDGAWNSSANTEETYLFWQHVRLAGFAPGPTDTKNPDYIPKNADGGIIGITSGVNPPIKDLRGTYIVCSEGILGRFAKQLDTMMDDGNTATGSMMAMSNQSANQTTSQTAITSTGTSPTLNEADSYTVCLAF
ncbi:MAG: prepilin-type N-terminal cleavage/methylation domain-containing protein [Azonexus sp.]|jgi:prepilin-type N-terminal cleavage/methylation domain-containing protein|nr:prepilin-type N-terminal cleavage/methylation domain-containing protein [Azonexus sp.]